MMSHIKNIWNSKNKTDSRENNVCCGCEACASICGHNAIEMKSDNEGFYYPVIHEEVCVDCGLCSHVCPIQNECCMKQPYIATYAGYTSDAAVLAHCTSGGFATELSKLIIRRGGGVVGVRYTTDFVNAEYHIATSLDDLSAFSGSKYVQSKKGDIYRKVRDLLNQKVLVLFIGCPCDVAALKLFLKKDNSNLLTCELVCMGVTSPRIAEDYINWSEKKNHSRLVSINARSKVKGWFVPHLEEHFENGKTKCSTLFGTYYGYGFQVFNRPSCYVCQYRGQTGVGDIRLGDFWGIKQTDPFWNPDGVSAIFVRTDKGMEFIKDIKQEGFQLFETGYETATLSNMSAYKNKPQKFVKLRERFARVYLEGNGLPAACWRTASLGFVVKHIVPDGWHKAIKTVYHTLVDHRL